VVVTEEVHKYSQAEMVLLLPADYPRVSCANIPRRIHGARSNKGFQMETMVDEIYCRMISMRWRY